MARPLLSAWVLLTALLAPACRGLASRSAAPHATCYVLDRPATLRTIAARRQLDIDELRREMGNGVTLSAGSFDLSRSAEEYAENWVVVRWGRLCHYETGRCSYEDILEDGTRRRWTAASMAELAVEFPGHWGKRHVTISPDGRSVELNGMLFRSDLPR